MSEDPKPTTPETASVKPTAEPSAQNPPNGIMQLIVLLRTSILILAKHLPEDDKAAVEKLMA